MYIKVGGEVMFDVIPTYIVHFLVASWRRLAAGWLGGRQRPAGGRRRPAGGWWAVGRRPQAAARQRAGGRTA